MLGAIAAGILGTVSIGAGTVGAIGSGTTTGPSPAHLPRSGHVCTSLLTDPTPPPRAPPSIGQPSDQASFVATASVPPLVRIVLDRFGVPVAVSTNTGTSPSCADYFVAFDGPYDTVGHLADLRLANEIVGLRFPGSWAPGYWHPIPSGAVEIP